MNSANSNMEDPLFIERLQALYEKEQADLQSFAQREHCNFEELQTRVAEWHCKHLFDTLKDASSTDTSQSGKTRDILIKVSRVLETLQTIAGLQSFFLVTNPYNLSDKGFLGGTPLGREFWRGRRGCGDAGAEAFKSHCVFALQISQPSPPLSMNPAIPTQSIPSQRRIGPAKTLKSEVYSTVRNALRVASGNQHAEMKWTNHSKLDSYGVQLIGWPSGIPMQSPSALTVPQNTIILEALTSGSMKFVPLGGSAGPRLDHQYTRSGVTTASGSDDPVSDVFRDSIDFSWEGEADSPSLEETLYPSVVDSWQSHDASSSTMSRESSHYESRSISHTPAHTPMLRYSTPPLNNNTESVTESTKKRRRDDRNSENSR
ncbi:hypothetical protein C8Q75DRAFT_810314 [Abortiporus biennis]|nr:hypothetical protein C8Q75DRAFT_810314 [Abortiporus biennis]